MCLIITGSSKLVRDTLLHTPGLLEDIHRSNSDGVGYMYVNKHGLKVVKKLAKHVFDLEHIISNMPQDDRNMAIHFRMKTHGDIDLANCHPYTVVDGEVAMMHNGILHTGNTADTTKSDTWHFIQDYLVDAVESAPDVVHSTGFRSLVGEFIGNNRFVFMSKDGTMSHVNYDQGVEVGKLWFSNTYAWTPGLLIPGYRMQYASAYHGSWYGSFRDDAGEMEDGLNHRYYSTKEQDAEDLALWESANITEETILDSVTEFCDTDAVAEMLDLRPYKVLRTLFEKRIPLRSRYADSNHMTSDYLRIVDAICDENISVLTSLAIKDVEAVAECLCYYIDWAEPVGEEAVTRQGQLDLVVDNERYAA